MHRAQTTSLFVFIKKALEEALNEIYALSVDFYLLTECLRNNKALQDSMQVEST